MSTAKRARAAATVRLNVYAILERAIEDGAACGWRRAFKHSDDEPSADVRERVTENVVREVMSALSEVVVWPEVEP